MQTAEKLPLELSAGAVKWTLKQLRFILRRMNRLCIPSLPQALSALDRLKRPTAISICRIFYPLPLNTGCDAIHPGFGFLSENSDFARLCKACGLVFIGPDYQVIDSMGNKSAARELMKRSGVPVVPGSDGAF